MRTRLLLAAAIAAALALSAASAGAQDDVRERSRAAFRRGVAQAEAGDYPSARDSFLEAYRIYAHPSILLNLGIARAHTGEWLDAEQDLVHFLADDGGAQPDELASARAELAQARKHLGTFRLRVSPSGARAMLDARALALIPGAFVDVRTTRGPHELRVAADGYAPLERPLDVSSDPAPDVDVRLAPGGGGIAGVDAGGHATAGGGDGGASVAAWTLVAGGGLAAILGAVAGVEAVSLANAYNTPNSGHFQDPGTKSAGETWRTTADASFVGAVVLGGIGAYLLLAPPVKPAAPARARLVVGPWIGVAGSF